MALVNIALYSSKAESIVSGGVGGVGCKVIFMSNPTFIKFLGCVVVGVFTI